MRRGDVHTEHPFNASVSASAFGGVGGCGIFAKKGGLNVGDVLEFTEGRLGWTWSSEAFYNGETGFVIHLNNGRCYLVDHHMDYKQAGHNGAHLLSAEFANTTARKGQKVDMHYRYMRPNNLTQKELQELAETQNGIIGSLIDDDGVIRVFIEVVRIAVEYSELLVEYDLNRFEINAHTHYRDGVQGFSVWSNHDKAKWVLHKVEFDPPNIDNIGIAIVDMVRHDLDAMDDMTDDNFRSCWLCKFILLAKRRFFESDLDYERARRSREQYQDPNEELFYHLPAFSSPIWFVLSKLELEITLWIHVQWQELAELNLRDSYGTLQARPDGWRDSCRPWSRQWWSYLRRLDGLNEQRNRPYYICDALGDVRGLSEWNAPFGTYCPTRT